MTYFLKNVSLSVITFAPAQIINPPEVIQKSDRSEPLITNTNYSQILRLFTDIHKLVVACRNITYYGIMVENPPILCGV